MDEGQEATTAPHTIRPFTTTSEFKECVRLQEDTWGAGFSERVPSAILRVSQMLGGVSAGAYDADGALVGFVFGMTGLRDGEVTHWSDMLAVRPEARDAGLGRRLKEYQRSVVMELGVGTMRWTFDPLQARNAHLNLTHLGIVVREYVEDMYGQSDSPLHRGIGTDRLVALWILASERVRARLTGKSAILDPDIVMAAPAALDAVMSGRHPRPTRPNLDLVGDELRLVIPADIRSLMADDLELAVEWRMATRAAFSFYLSAGYEVTEFARGKRTSAYLLTRHELGTA